MKYICLICVLTGLLCIFPGIDAITRGQFFFGYDNSFCDRCEEYDSTLIFLVIGVIFIYTGIK